MRCLCGRRLLTVAAAPQRVCRSVCGRLNGCASCVRVFTQRPTSREAYTTWSSCNKYCHVQASNRLTFPPRRLKPRHPHGLYKQQPYTRASDTQPAHVRNQIAESVAISAELSLKLPRLRSSRLYSWLIPGDVATGQPSCTTQRRACAAGLQNVRRVRRSVQVLACEM